MDPAETKETNNIAPLIAAETDADLESIVGSHEKVSEIVAETAGENIPVTTPKIKTPPKTGFLAISQKISGLLFSKPQKPQKLPSPIQQKREVKQAIMDETHKLVKKATKIQNQKHFSASKLEKVIEEIRYLRRTLAELVSATVQRIEALYRQYVWK